MAFVRYSMSFELLRNCLIKVMKLVFLILKASKLLTYLQT